MANLKLSNNKMILGVCAGFAEFFHWDTTLVRVATVILACMGGIGVFGYLLIALIMHVSNK
ncbi:MAG: PspC domain-containing protein [Paludibacteraceae bacterium]|nr:PspC domain-containing protein [Paludibacteraceae bacterium]